MSHQTGIDLKFTIEESPDESASSWLMTVKITTGDGTESEKEYIISALTPQLVTAYENWREGYLKFGEPQRFYHRVISISENPIETNFSETRAEPHLRNTLIAEFNHWLSSNPRLSKFIADTIKQIQHSPEYRNSPEFRAKCSLLLETKIHRQESQILFQKLPWAEWKVISSLALQTGIVFSYDNASLPSLPPQQLRAIVICGKYQIPHNHIDTEQDLQNIVKYLQHDLKNVEIVSWFPDYRDRAKNLEALIEELEKTDYHLLFFCGHSNSTAGGRIYLDDVEYIEVGADYFKHILSSLKERGLILAFFNSCDGLGIAETLTSVGIPYVAVMKEPVHDIVAQKFIGLFLKKAVESNHPIHVAFNLARMQLRANSSLPDGDFLPVLFKHHQQHPFYFNQTLVSPEAVKTPRSIFAKKSLFYPVLAIATSLVCIVGYSIYSPFLPISICQFAARTDKISCGEEILIQPNGGSQNHKERGFALIKQTKYRSAIKELDQDWQDNRDPETAIAIENAKIAEDLQVTPDLKVKTIAVVVPAKTNTPHFIADTILKGIVYAQQQHNQNSSRDWKLRIVMADDANDPEQGKIIARQLATRSDLLGIIGHYSSNVTVPIINAKIYDNNFIVISPTATSHELTNNSNTTTFFRLPASSEIAAEDIVKNWVTPQRKIALFYVPSKKFSSSLTEQFKQKIKHRYGDNNNIIVYEKDLEKSSNIKQEIENISKKANAIVLFPDAYTGNPTTNKKSLDVITYNQGKLPILGNTSIYDLYNQLKPDAIAAKFYQNMVVSVPWHYSNQFRYPEQLIVTKKPFQQLPEIPDWWLAEGKSIDSLDERIAMSYDATLVILTALNNNSNDFYSVRTAMTSGYSLQGITGKISFNGSDRAEKINSLITPNCVNNRCEGWSAYQPQ